MLSKGTIILVNLNPTKGSETGKIRPCVVVSNNKLNKILPIVQVTPLTNWSEKKSQIITNIEVVPNSINNLDKKSIIDCIQTRPIDIQRRYIKSIGSVSAEVTDEIDKSLKIIFDL